MKKNRQHIHNRYLIRLLFFFIHIAAFGTVKAQTVTGSVLTEENKPINGATVMIKGSSKATITNVAGKFSIPGAATDNLTTRVFWDN